MESPRHRRCGAPLMPWTRRSASYRASQNPRIPRTRRDRLSAPAGRAGDSRPRPGRPGGSAPARTDCRGQRDRRPGAALRRPMPPSMLSAPRPGVTQPAMCPACRAGRRRPASQHLPGPYGYQPFVIVRGWAVACRKPGCAAPADCRMAQRGAGWPGGRVGGSPGQPPGTQPDRHGERPITGYGRFRDGLSG
jgi:hypothetical protein